MKIQKDEIEKLDLDALIEFADRSLENLFSAMVKMTMGMLICFKWF